MEALDCEVLARPGAQALGARGDRGIAIGRLVLVERDWPSDRGAAGGGTAIDVILYPLIAKAIVGHVAPPFSLQKRRDD